jgi:rhodanese-related sulfurtransferase
MKIFAALLVGLLVVGVSCVRADDSTNAAPTKATHVDGKEAGKLVAKGDITVIDIRTPSEFAGGHIAGATNINYRANNFSEQIEKLDRDKTYLVHCAVGARSTSSLPKFEKLGFKHIIHLDGGIRSWEAAGNPVEKK